MSGCRPFIEYPPTQPSNVANASALRGAHHRTARILPDGAAAAGI